MKAKRFEFSLSSDVYPAVELLDHMVVLGDGNGNALQCSCLDNPREGGAWWAAVYGVPQSAQVALGFRGTHRILERQETVADPATGGPITADVGESLVQVAVRSTEGDLFNGLVHQQILGGRPGKECELSLMYSFSIPFVSGLCPVPNGLGTCIC